MPKKTRRFTLRTGTISQLKGYAFIAPNFILLSIFTIFPMVFSLVLSFTEWDLLSGFGNIKFVGLQNFIRLFTDDWFKTAFVNTLVFTVCVVPVTMFISLFLAYLLDGKVFGSPVLRLCFFLPYITSVSAVSILWTMLYNPNGPIASGLRAIGITAPNFLADPKWALPAVIVMTIWMNFGYCTMIYVAAMQSVPRDVYESADIDGVNGFVRFFRITVPMVSKTTFFILITQMIASFKVFGQIQIMTGGGPVRSTSVLAYYIYESAFKNYEFGYASAMALVLFCVILIITIVQWKQQKKFDY